MGTVEQTYDAHEQEMMVQAEEVLEAFSVMAIESSWIYTSLDENSIDADGFLIKLDLDQSPLTDSRESYISVGDTGIMYDLLESTDPDPIHMKLYGSVVHHSFPTVEVGLSNIGYTDYGWTDTDSDEQDHSIQRPFELNEFSFLSAMPRYSVNVTYAYSEYSRLRERFGAPEGSTFSSLIGDTISGSLEALISGISQTYNKRVSTNKQIDKIELFANTTAEAAQNVSVSLATVTGSAGVTSTSGYSAGGGY